MRSVKIISEKIWMTTSGQKILFHLFQNPAARRVSLKIGLKKGLEIVVPMRFSIQKLPEVLREKEAWILKNLQKINERQEAKKTMAFRDGAEISILGVKKIVRFSVHEHVRARVEEHEREVIIYSRVLHDDRSQSHSRREQVDGRENLVYKNILEKYLKTRAKIYFLERVREVAARMDLTYRKISVRAQTSRWGSCTRRKDLSFNWRLILAPAEVADYVVVHELAHTKHLNHSKNFYDLVEKFCPEYKKFRTFLRKVEF